MNGHDIPKPSAQSASYCFAVRGLGERTSARIVANREDLDAAIAICDDEIALIDAAITSDGISKPAALESEHPHFDIEVEREAPKGDDLRLLRYPSAELMTTHGGTSRLLKRTRCSSKPTAKQGHGSASSA